jgi:hypothetical protein
MTARRETRHTCPVGSGTSGPGAGVGQTNSRELFAESQRHAITYTSSGAVHRHEIHAQCLELRYYQSGFRHVEAAAAVILSVEPSAVAGGGGQVPRSGPESTRSTVRGEFRIRMGQ